MKIILPSESIIALLHAGCQKRHNSVCVEIPPLTTNISFSGYGFELGVSIFNSAVITSQAEKQKNVTKHVTFNCFTVRKMYATV